VENCERDRFVESVNAKGVKMSSGSLKFFLLLGIVAVALPMSAQSATAPPANERGFFEVENFQGTINSSSSVLKLDSTGGYDFNKHFGVFAGLPVYFASVPGTITNTTGTTSGNSVTGIGNFYMGLAFRRPNPALNYGSTITLGAPTGSTSKGLSSGRGTVDWANHFDHSFHRFTPFVNAGFANTVPDSTLLTRPFTSLGAVGHFEEGGEYTLRHHFSVGGAAYEITPFGNQKVFSKLVGKGQTATGSGKNHGVFQNTFFSSGNDLTRENGLTTWVAFEPTPLWRAELGYARSVTFSSNSFSFNLGLNVGRLLRTSKTQ
jgi:hypothetical protein